MIRTCNGSDPNLRTPDGAVGNCGRTFDDVNHWTTCPHAEFPVNPEAWRLLGDDVADDGSRATGLPGWSQAGNGRWYPPSKQLGPDPVIDLGGDTVPIEPGEPATVRGEQPTDAGPGPGYHQHNDGSWHRDADDGMPGAPAPEPGTDESRIAAALARYQAAAHAVQSGVAFMMHRNRSLADPKHLRVGVDTAKVEQAALAHLLIERGLFTAAEYFEAIADHMEFEVRRNEEQLTRMYGKHGTKVHLG